MIFNKSNQTFAYKGKKYKIGDRVVVVEKDEYEGLFGVITEIRTDADKDTENITPDIYCKFEKPIMPDDIRELERKFSIAYGAPKKLDDIILDVVIMAPEMLALVSDVLSKNKDNPVYIVTDDWASHDEYDSVTELFSDLSAAKTYMRKQIRQMRKSGGLFERCGEREFIENSSELSYEAYIEGRYDSEHYWIRIEKKAVCK